MVWSTTQSTLYGAAEQRCPGSSDRAQPQTERPRCEDRPLCEERPCREERVRCADRRRSDPLSALLGDRDALLIAAVIFLLMNEKADMKLILALVFVLLG